MGKKYGDKEREKGNSKMEGKSPQGEGKGPKFKKKQKFRKSIDRSSFTATWTLDTVVKPFGTTVNKEVRNKVETSEKIV